MNLKKIRQLHRQTVRYYLKKAAHYPWTLTFFFTTSTLAILGQEFVSVLILKDILDLMSQNAENPKSALPQMFDLVTKLAIIYLVFAVVCWRIAEMCNNYFQPSVMRDIEDDSFKALQNHSYHFFSNQFSGGLVSKVNRFSRSFEMMADVIQWNFWKMLVVLTASLIAIYSFIPLVAIVLITWAFFYAFLTYLYARWATKFWRKNATLDSKVTAEIADNLTNIFNIKIFSAKQTEKKRFKKTIDSRRKARSMAWISGAVMNAWQGLLMVALEIAVIIMTINAWSEGEITIGVVFAIQSFIWIVFMYLWELGRLFQDYSNALADAEEMTEILHLTPSILDPEKPEKCRIKQGDIRFKQVDFKYETEKKSPAVFKDFNLHIPAGQKVGLVGESGAGKSTFVNLLIRFMDVNKGHISIDEQNISSIKQDDLRASIAYVPQEPILFHRTLKENIAYGRPDATEAQIIAAAKAAHAHEFIQTFTEKYETLVGERGVKLSGGQKQRIAIARAMLKSAPVLILDEATSSLDSKAEQHIQAALEELMKDRTTLVIAHRLSTLRQMDRIVVFESGQITEEGTHDQLVAKGGKYAELWAHQSGGFIS